MNRFNDTPTRERSELIAQYERRANALENEIRTLRNRPPSSEPVHVVGVPHEDFDQLKQENERLRVDAQKAARPRSAAKSSARKSALDETANFATAQAQAVTQLKREQASRIVTNLL